LAQVGLASPKTQRPSRLALVDVEYRVFPHHGNDAGFAILALSIGHPKVFYKVDFRAVLALAHVAA